MDTAGRIERFRRKYAKSDAGKADAAKAEATKSNWLHRRRARVPVLQRNGYQTLAVVGALFLGEGYSRVRLRRMSLFPATKPTVSSTMPLHCA